MPVIDRAFAQELAAKWIAAWNSHDLERVYSLYADDFEMRSPLIAERGFSASGVLKGKDAIRPYWGGGIATANPPLDFRLVEVFAGVNTVAITYRSIGRHVVTEILELDDAGRIIRGSATHGPKA